MPASGRVVAVVNPGVVAVTIDEMQTDVPSGVHQLSVASLAQAHQIDIAVDSLSQAGSGFVLEQAVREVLRAPQPVADVNQLVRAINTAEANVSASTDGHWLTITSIVPGTSQSLRATLDGTTAKVSEKQAAADASMTLDQVVVPCIANVGRAAGLQLQAVSVGSTSVTVAESSLPSYMFPLVMSYLIALVVVVILYKVEPGHMFRWLPSQVGPVPLSVPLFGAIGAVIVSLQGLFKHGDAWLPSYNLWHIARPLVGAVLGFVAVLFLILLIDAAQASATNTGTSASTTTTSIAAVSGASSTSTSPANTAPGSSTVGGLSAVILYDAIAFIVGYREETFRSLLSRVTDVILGPSGIAGDAGVSSPGT